MNKKCTKCGKLGTVGEGFYKSSPWCSECIQAKTKSRSASQDVVRTSPANAVEQKALAWLRGEGIIALPGINYIDLLIHGAVRVEVKSLTESSDFSRSGEGICRYTLTPKQRSRFLADIVMLEEGEDWHIFPSDYIGFYTLEGQVKSAFIYNPYYTEKTANPITTEDWQESLNNLAPILEAIREISRKLRSGELNLDSHLNK